MENNKLQVTRGVSTYRWHQSLCALVVLLLSTPAWAVDYTITGLGALGGYYSYGNSINTNGEAVGYVFTAGAQQHAFLYSNGSVADLGTTSAMSNALGINNSGQVVGSASTANNPSISRPFVYSNGSMTDLGTLGGASGAAVGINNAGQIVGSATTASNWSHAFLFANGSMTDIGTLGGTTSNATAINNNGLVVGSASTASNAQHAFLYSNGSMMDLGLGTLGGTTSNAMAINDNSQVVGSFTTASSVQHAFLYSNGTTAALDTPDFISSIARGINNYGQIVGDARTNGNVTLHAFLYSNGIMTDLNSLLPATSGWNLISASGINDAGQIIGTGQFNGQTMAFIMSPTAVPVPAAVWLLGSGLLGLLGMARRRSCKART